MYYLVPSIFVPFHGVPDDPKPAPVERDEKLHRILENVEKQHDAVRRNMMFLVSVEQKRIVADARAALRAEGLNDNPTLIGEHETSELLEILRAPAEIGVDYTYQATDFARPQATAETDIEMGGTTEGSLARVQAIRDDVHTQLRQLVTEAAFGTLPAYDKQAQATDDFYKSALQRYVARKSAGSVPVTPAVGTGAGSRRGSGILTNKGEAGRLNHEALARMEVNDEYENDK